ncbi:hypothetical protein ACYQR9_23100 [Methylobacterium sp. CM6241]
MSSHDEDLGLWPWEERLLGRPLFDTKRYLSGVPLFDMTGEERGKWDELRASAPVAIDEWTAQRLKANRAPHLDLDGLGCSPGSDRCPYYMARWHTVFAATMANIKLGWSPSPAGIDRAREAVRACFTQDYALRSQLLASHSRVQKSLIESRAQLKDQATQCSKLIQAIGKTTLLHNAPYVDGAPSTDVMQSLSPWQCNRYGGLLTNARRASAELSENLSELEAILRSPENKATDPDGNIWLREFAGFMCVAWGRLIHGRPIGEGPDGIGFVSNAFDSLLTVSPDWAADGGWDTRIRSGKEKAAHYTDALNRRAPLSPRHDQSR